MEFKIFLNEDETLHETARSNNEVIKCGLRPTQREHAKSEGIEDGLNKHWDNYS